MINKRIVILAHYYYPDVASTGQLLKELAEYLTSDFNVTVICTVPSYTGKIDEKYKDQKSYIENINNVNVIRVRVPEFNKNRNVSRIINIISYYLYAKMVIKRLKNVDIVFALSQPPILGGLLGIYAKRKLQAKLIYNIQDFNPEQIMVVNHNLNKILIKALMYLDKSTCKKSDLIITVGRDLVETLGNRFNNKNVPKNIMINNWTNEDEIYPLDCQDERIKEFKAKYNLNNKKVVMYSGNIGLYYDLENIIKVIGEFKENKSVVFVFVGEGTKKEELVEYVDNHKIKNVVFIPYQEKNNLNVSLNSGDIHLCVNAKGIKGVSCPSKYYGIAACGKPVIGVLEVGSEIHSTISEISNGYLSEPGDYNSLKKNIQLALESEDLEKMGLRGYTHFINNLTKEKSLSKYKKAIEEL